jgi:hypothetical protein
MDLAHDLCQLFRDLPHQHLWQFFLDLLPQHLCQLFPDLPQHLFQLFLDLPQHLFQLFLDLPHQLLCQSFQVLPPAGDNYEGANIGMKNENCNGLGSCSIHASSIIGK